MNLQELKKEIEKLGGSKPSVFNQWPSLFRYAYLK